MSPRSERLWHRAIAQALPEAIDLWVVVLQAGLDFQVALHHYLKRAPESALKDELLRVQNEMATGVPRLEALRRLRDRVPEPTLRETVQTLLQGMTLGSSLVPLLKRQAMSLRRKRTFEAERQAALTPLKLMFPLFVFIFPTLLLSIFGPLYLAAQQGVFR